MHTASRINVAGRVDAGGGLARFRDRAPWWGGDLQTVRNRFLARRRTLPSQTVRLEFPMSDGSGDRLAGSLETPLHPLQGSPLMLLVHGLTGCEDSPYVRETARFHLERGRRVLRLNLRGAGPSRPVADGYYHAGCASDLQDVLDQLADEEARDGIFAVGFSLGGNILLNLLERERPGHRLVGAATISAPIEPLQACERIMAPRNALYHRFLLTNMKRDVLTSPALSDREKRIIAAARSVYEFDDQWVAPRNGFADARDYYTRTAGARFVNGITVPTLMLHADNDPWIPARSYLELGARPVHAVNIVVASGGGHVGFHERGESDTWHDRMIEGFLTEIVG